MGVLQKETRQHWYGKWSDGVSAERARAERAESVVSVEISPELIKFFVPARED